MVLGCLLIGVGIIMAFCFAAVYDTAVEAGGQHVNNIGLEVNRLIGVICGIGLAFFGSGLLLIGQMISLRAQARRTADALEATGKIVAEQDAEWRKKQAPSMDDRDLPSGHDRRPGAVSPRSE